MTGVESDGESDDHGDDRREFERDLDGSIVPAHLEVGAASA
jgi:hypothetical protein